MDFRLNGRTITLDAATVRTRVRGWPPDPIRTHWIQIDDQRWPPKQAFRIATGLTDEPFISHFAIRVFRKLGFETSSLPQETGDLAPAPAPPAAAISSADDQRQAVEAFLQLDGFMSRHPLTATLAGLEAELASANRVDAIRVAVASGFQESLLDAALVVRERVGMLDTLIHAAVITQVLPMILDDDEVLINRPSLGAGNDPGRVYDLETNKRVAEFKVSSWKGRDSMRQRGLFADVAGLSLDDSGRRRQVFVVGQRPVDFLTKSNRNALQTLAKSSLRLRTPPGMTETMTVRSFTEAASIEIIDLRSLLPGLR